MLDVTVDDWNVLVVVLNASVVIPSADSVVPFDVDEPSDIITTVF